MDPVTVSTTTATVNPAESLSAFARVMHVIKTNPGSGLGILGALLVLTSIFGTRKITLPVVNWTIDLQLDTWSRNAAFFLGVACLIGSVIIGRFLNH